MADQLNLWVGQPVDDYVDDDDPNKEGESDLGTVIKSQDAYFISTDWTVGTILSQIQSGRIELSPSFQRREAWKDDRKSRFIESLLLRLPVPQLVLAESRSRKGTFIIIDGKQRLLALRRFVATDDNDGDEGFTPLRLTGLTIESELNGKTFAEIQDDPSWADIIPAFENTPIRTSVLQNWRDERYLYVLFHRLNSGSLPLSPQELRQALIPGPFMGFIEERSRTSMPLKRALGIDHQTRLPNARR